MTTLPKRRYFAAAIVGWCVMVSAAHAVCEDPQAFEARRQALEASVRERGRWSIKSPDVDAMPIYTVKAEYPLRASLTNQEGWVQVHFNVDTEGNVTDPVVVASSQPEIFDEAALAAISQWRYKPKLEGSVAVERKDVDAIVRLCPEE